MKIDRDLVDEAMRLYGISSYKDLAQRAHLDPGHLSCVLSRGTCNASTAKKLISVLSYAFYPGAAAEQARQQMEYKRAEHLANEKAKAIKEFLDRKIMSDWNRWSVQHRLIFWNQNLDRAYPQDLLERDRVCAVEILQELFRKRPENITRADVAAINQFLTTLPGWKKTAGSIRFGPYGKQRGFVRAEHSLGLGNFSLA